MSNQSTPLPGDPQLGYIFYPSKRPDEPGHPRLDIILRETPTGLHFDPSKVLLHTVSQAGEVHSSAIDHPWDGLGEYKVLAGRVVIQDHVGKSHQAFTFGADLNIQTDDEQTLCVLSSEAPIYSLEPENRIVNLFVQEVEILLAERRAAWGDNVDGFERRLASIRPLSLYSACLGALRQRFQHYPHSEEELIQRLTRFLHTESQALHSGSYPSFQAPPLAELLQP